MANNNVILVVLAVVVIIIVVKCMNTSSSSTSKTHTPSPHTNNHGTVNNSNHLVVKNYDNPSQHVNDYELLGVASLEPAFEIGFGVGPGLYGSGRAFSEMIGN